MKKTMLVFLAVCLVGAVGFGAGSARAESYPEKPATSDEAKPMPSEGTRAAKYPRLAFVCAPGTGADPQYVPMVLREIEATVPKFLSEQNLHKVSTIPDAAVDTSAATPTVRFKDLSDYDAVAVVTYTYSGPEVLLDINLLDAKTGQKLWFVQLHAKSDNIELRLSKLAQLVPHRINKYFYRKG